jgi:hypothetical protein
MIGAFSTILAIPSDARNGPSAEGKGAFDAENAALHIMAIRAKVGNQRLIRDDLRQLPPCTALIGRVANQAGTSASVPESHQSGIRRARLPFVVAARSDRCGRGESSEEMARLGNAECGTSAAPTFLRPNGRIQ